MRPFAAASLAIGDRIRVTTLALGRVVLERIDPPLRPLTLLAPDATDDSGEDAETEAADAGAAAAHGDPPCNPYARED